MFGKAKRERERLERSGRRAPATVVEIASFGLNIGDAQPGHVSSNSEAQRMTTLRVHPEGEPEFEVKRKIRYGRYGRTVPKAGDRIEILYDPDDHNKVVVAPPTAEEEQMRAAVALSKAKIGFSVGGKDSDDVPISDEFLQEHQQAMADAQKAQEMMQQFTGGEGPTTAPGAGSFDTTVQLQQLEALRDGGALTDEQFETAKARLLER